MSSIMSKMLDNIIIEKQQFAVTNNHPKSMSSYCSINLIVDVLCIIKLYVK